MQRVQGQKGSKSTVFEIERFINAINVILKKKKITFQLHVFDANYCLQANI